MFSELKIDRRQPTPIGRQFFEQVGAMIEQGKLADSHKFPPLRVMEKQLGIGICTLQKAFVELETAGFVTKIPRRGMFVKPTAERQAKVIKTVAEKKDLRELRVAIVINKYDFNHAREFSLLEVFEAAISEVNGLSFVVKIPRSGLDHHSLLQAVSNANAIFYVGYAEESNDPLVRMILSTGLPVVTYGYRGNIRVSGVYDDWDLAMRKIMDYLIELGHKKIAFASYYLENKEDFNWLTQRETSFLDIAKFRELSIDKNDVYKLGFYEGKSFNQIIDIGEKLGEMIFTETAKYSAIVAVNDVVAEGLFRAAKKLKLNVPEDISITGFDNSQSAIEHGLTTIIHPLHDDAKAAAEIVIKLFEAENPGQVFQVANGPKLVIRKSVKRLTIKN